MRWQYRLAVIALITVSLSLGTATATVPGMLASLVGKIKHVIVLMEENRSFDHFFGWPAIAKKLGVNGLTGTEFNFINLSNPSDGKVSVSDSGRYVNPCDPNHGTPATAQKIKDGMAGFVDYENDAGHAKENWCDVMSSFAPGKIPVITTLAEEFAVMDRMFCSHPGPTWPNRLFALTATSLGMTETGCWYEGVPGKLFPQKTFFDQLEASELKWKNYYNDTPWELFVEKLAHSSENIRPLNEFYDDAAAGRLPSYAWINPRCGMNVTTGEGSNDQHPDHDVALGEALYKDIYEALRASPQWNETLFIITMDEHGGFYDHVTPPKAPSPENTGSSSYPDHGYNFTSLGVRIPTLLISPWIERGTVLSAPPAPQQPHPDSEYDLTSIMATTRKLLGMPTTPLTHRDAWTGTFEHVISRDSPRADCPKHLPDPPEVSLNPIDEAKLPLNDLQRSIAEVHAHLANNSVASAADIFLRPQGHISRWLHHRYNAHSEATMQWRDSKRISASGTVVTRPPTVKKPAWITTFGITFGDATSVQTINGNSGVWCLEWQNITMQVSASRCYPSMDPRYNRDRDQQWVTKSDATIRPAKDISQCLTNVRFHSASDVLTYNVSIMPCDGRVEQHWGVGVENPTDKVSSITFATSMSLGII